MTTLNEYLSEKRRVLIGRQTRIGDGHVSPQNLSAFVAAEGRSGIRRIRIRDFQVITDSPRDFAGYDLGPSSPELQLGVLGSCLNHSFLIQAAWLGIAIDSLEVEVTAQFDPRAGHKDFPDVPFHPHNIHFIARIVSDARDDDLVRLFGEVERTCPILNLLRKPQDIQGGFERLRSEVTKAVA